MLSLAIAARSQLPVARKDASGTAFVALHRSSRIAEIANETFAPIPRPQAQALWLEHMPIKRCKDHVAACVVQRSTGLRCPNGGEPRGGTLKHVDVGHLQAGKQRSRQRDAAEQRCAARFARTLLASCASLELWQPSVHGIISTSNGRNEELSVQR